MEGAQYPELTRIKPSTSGISFIPEFLTHLQVRNSLAIPLMGDAQLASNRGGEPLRLEGPGGDLRI